MEWIVIGILVAIGFYLAPIVMGLAWAVFVMILSLVGNTFRFLRGDY